MSDIKIVAFTGREIDAVIPKLADLRIEIFAEYPFLYEGSLEDEKQHIKKFFAMEDAIVVAAFDQDKIVGISTAYPFIYEKESFQKLFLKHQRAPQEYFIIGEVALQKQYRRLGIGKKILQEIEAYAQKLNSYKYFCLYTFVRSPEDPRRPSDYYPETIFWKNRGFVEHPELHATVAYREIGESKKTPKKIRFWTKDIN